jgi:tetratricopeptide (TPR) repeat protein
MSLSYRGAIGSARLRRGVAILALTLVVVASLGLSACGSASGGENRTAQAEQLIARGEGLMEQGWWRDAIGVFDAAIQLDPAIAAAYANRGSSHAALGEFPQAVADLSRAIELDPAQAVYYSNRARVYTILKDYEKAVADFDAAIYLNPEDYDSYLQRAILKADKLRQHDAALLDYNRAIELRPSSADAYYNRGRLYDHQSKFREALADFNRALELEITPDLHPFLFYQRGRAKFGLNQYLAAIADFNTAIELDARWPHFFAFRGLAYAKIGLRRQAISDLEHFVQRSNDRDLVALVERVLAELR